LRNYFKLYDEEFGRYFILCYLQYSFNKEDFYDIPNAKYHKGDYIRRLGSEWGCYIFNIIKKDRILLFIIMLVILIYIN
jgi:hypothetical protein